jgi:hypothetical protein
MMPPGLNGLLAPVVTPGALFSRRLKKRAQETFFSLRVMRLRTVQGRLVQLLSAAITHSGARTQPPNVEWCVVLCSKPEGSVLSTSRPVRSVLSSLTKSCFEDRLRRSTRKTGLDGVLCRQMRCSHSGPADGPDENWHRREADHVCREQ